MNGRGRLAGASVLAALLTAPWLAGQTAAPPQGPSAFRAAADAVSVDVSVQRDRRPVPDLKPSDFAVLDNGVPQEITDVTYERLPIDVTLLLDVSASVTGTVLDELRRALRQVRADLRPGDRLRLITFNMRVQRVVDFGDAASDVDQALPALTAGGSSAVLDGLAVALTTPELPGRRRLIVLFSDGQDSSSITEADTLLDVVRRSASTVAFILGSLSSDRPASLLRTTSATVGGFANRVAEETGGVVTSVTRGESLPSQFRRMLQDFRASYVLYFTPQGVDRSGAHTLDVRVNRPGVTVRARRGYIWR